MNAEELKERLKEAPYYPFESRDVLMHLICGVNSCYPLLVCNVDQAFLFALAKWHPYRRNYGDGPGMSMKNCHDSCGLCVFFKECDDCPIVLSGNLICLDSDSAFRRWWDSQRKGLDLDGKSFQMFHLLLNLWLESEKD